jgi:hypothetical protein
MPSPYEEVSIPSPVPGYRYSFRALDNYAANCACGAAAPILLDSTFTVYRNGVPVQTNPAVSYCDLFTPTFNYTY